MESFAHMNNFGFMISAFRGRFAPVFALYSLLFDIRMLFSHDSMPPQARRDGRGGAGRAVEGRGVRHRP